MEFEILAFESLESTNDHAKKLLLEGKNNISVLAKVQTKGRGRFDREWVSEDGGLYMSLGVALDSVDKIHVLTLAASLVVAKVTEMKTGKKATVKWPNDVYIDDKKVCGILTEIVSDKKSNVVVGIGLNVNQKKLPKDLLHKATTFFQETKEEYNRKEIGAMVTMMFGAYLEEFMSGNFDKIISEWKDNSYSLGKEVTIKTKVSEISGKAVDITSDGHLIVEKGDGSKETVVEGDLFV